MGYLVIFHLLSLPHGGKSELQAYIFTLTFVDITMRIRRREVLGRG